MDGGLCSCESLESIKCRVPNGLHKILPFDTDAEELFGKFPIQKNKPMRGNAFQEIEIMSALSNRLKQLFKDEDGQTMVEYVMLIVLVALAVFILSPNIKDAIITVFQNTSSALK